MSGDDNIASEIKERRLAVELSREGLAYKAGVSVKTIERIELGASKPRRATLSVIRAALERETAEPEAQVA